MAIKAILNSVGRGTGAKPFDSEVGAFFTHFCEKGGILPHEEWDGTNPITQNDTPGASVLVKNSTWIVPVERTGTEQTPNYTGYEKFYCHVQIFGQEQVTTSGTGLGAVVLKVQKTKVQPGAVCSEFGLEEATLEFIGNNGAEALTDAEIESQIGLTYFWARVCDVDCSNGTVTDAEISDPVVPTVKFPGGVNLSGASIVGLSESEDANSAATRGYVQGLIDQLIGIGGSFGLVGSRAGTFFPRKLDWADSIDSGSYYVERNDDGAGWTTIATLPSTTLTYTDTDALSGSIAYRIRAVSAEQIQIYSNEVTFNGTQTTTVGSQEYGDGSDGVYTGGALQRGRIYQFSSLDLASSMSFTGSGLAIVFVQGDATFRAASSIDQSPYTTSFSGNSITVAGQGLNLTPSQGASGSLGTAGLPAQYGYDNGVCMGCFSPSPGSAANGSTGAAPQGSDGLLLIVGGNLTIETGAEINAPGGNGNNGSAGTGNQNGTVSFCGLTPTLGRGGGAGGAGSGSRQGMKVAVFHGGTKTGNFYENLQAGTPGNGGAGGAPGSATGVAGPYNCRTTATAGTAGTAGSAAPAGTLNYYVN